MTRIQQLKQLRDIINDLVADEILKADANQIELQDSEKFVIYGIIPLHKVKDAYVKHCVKLNSNLQDKTAKLLEIDRKTLYRIMKNAT